MVPQQEVRRLVEIAVNEDLGWGDATSEAIIPADLKAVGKIVAREEGVLAGIEVATEVFRVIDPSVEFEGLVADGEVIKSAQPLAMVRGPARSILAGERVALNFLQHLSGVATLTSRYVRAVAGHRASLTLGRPPPACER